MNSEEKTVLRVCIRVWGPAEANAHTHTGPLVSFYSLASAYEFCSSREVDGGVVASCAASWCLRVLCENAAGHRLQITSVESSWPRAGQKLNLACIWKLKCPLRGTEGCSCLTNDKVPFPASFASIVAVLEGFAYRGGCRSSRMNEGHVWICSPPVPSSRVRSHTCGAGTLFGKRTRGPWLRFVASVDSEVLIC